MTPTTRSFPSERDMRADVFAPEGDDQRTAVLVMHGGGWRVGGPEHLHPRCRTLARKGFTVIAVEYRLLGEAPWPAPLVDVRAAVRWTHANADELGVDPDRIVVQGHSAGAHLSLLTAYTDDPDGQTPRPAAVVAFYPPIGFYAAPQPEVDPETGRARRGPRRDDGLAPAWMVLEDPEDEELVRSISPIDQVGPHCPPTMIVHGTADGMVSYQSSLVLHRALVEAGVPADLHLHHGANHEFDAMAPFTETVQDAVAHFYRRTVSQIPDPAASASPFPAPGTR